MSSVSPPTSSSTPDWSSSFDGAGAGLHRGDLVLGTLERLARVTDVPGNPRGALVHRSLRFRGGVLGFQHFLLGTEVVHPLLQRVEGVLKLLLLLGELLMLGLHRIDLALGSSLAGQGLPRQILPALRQRRRGLFLEVIHRMLELLFLQLDPLARGRDLHQPPADLGDLIEHLLVGKVEHLVGLLGGVERLVGLGLHYLVGSLEKAHLGLLLVIVDGPRRFRCRIRVDRGTRTGTDTPEATAGRPPAYAWCRRALPRPIAGRFSGGGHRGHDRLAVRAAGDRGR